MSDHGHSPEQTSVTDSMIERDRFTRALCAILIAAILLLVPCLILRRIFADWFNYGKLGGLSGLIVGVLLISLLYDQVVVRVALNHAFVTIDLLQAFIKTSNVYVVYGPGLHISFPWESREERGNIYLGEVSEGFELTVNTATGTLTVKGSYRIRPRFDTDSLVIFLGSVAAIAADISGIIKGFITGDLAGQNIDHALKSTAALNRDLQEHFHKGESGAKHHAVSEFETRFGLVVGDVTVSELSLSAEAQKTRSGLDEAETVAKGTAIMMGFRDTSEKTAVDQMMEAVANGSRTASAQERAQSAFLAISENVKTERRIQDIQIHLDGMTPELASALAAITPHLARLLTTPGRT